MIGDDQGRDREKRRGRIPRWVDKQADHPPGHTGEGPGLQQDVLIEDATAQRLGSHRQDVPGDPEDQQRRQTADEPGGEAGQRAFDPQGQQPQSQQAQTAGPADRTPQAARPEHQEDEGHQTGRGHRGQDQRQRPGRRGNQGNRQQAECSGDEKPATFPHQIALFFLVGP